MSLTPRRMKGATVVGRSMPCARPQAATVPSGFICEITLASVTEPTESMQAAQRDLASGFTGVVELVAVDDAGGTEALEEGLFRHAARRGDHAVAELREDHDRRGADAARRTRHQHVAIRRLHALLFQRHHAEHGGIAGHANGHAVGGRPALGHRHQPVADDARQFGEAAMVTVRPRPSR